MTLTNTSSIGSLNLHDITITDILPTQLITITTVPTYTVTPADAATVDCTGTHNLTVSCFIDDFEPGTVVTITFSAKVNPNVTPGTTTHNQATAESNDIGTVMASFDTAITAPPTKVAIAVFLQGINTELTLVDIKKQIKSGHSAASIVGMGEIPTAVSKALPSDTQFFQYSYTGSGPKTGNPTVYHCEDTFRQSIVTDMKLLQQQIISIAGAQPRGTDIDLYLIGHSLGGAVAFGFVDFLEQGLLVALPRRVHLKAVITLDSPVGGVHDFWTNSYVVRKVYAQSCDLKNVSLKSPGDLTTVLDSTIPPFHTTPPDDGGVDPLGAQASFLALPDLPKNPNPVIPSNEFLAEQAQVDLGTSFLTIGNVDDLVWHTQACNPLLPGTVDTQWLEDEGKDSGLYGRSFASKTKCPGLTSPKLADTVVASHRAVLFNRDVQAGIKAFLKGNTPNTLTPQPQEDGGSD